MDEIAKKRVPLKLNDDHIKVISVSLATMKTEGPPVPAMGGLESFAKPILNLLGRGWSNAQIAERLTNDLRAAEFEIEVGAHHIQRLVRKLKEATSSAATEITERKSNGGKRAGNQSAAKLDGVATGSPERAGEPASESAPILPPQASAPAGARRPQFV